MELNEQKLIGAKVIIFENSTQIQPLIVLRCTNGKEYNLTISNDHKFIVTQHIELRK